ncbi:hypothetical protein ANN_03966 [Periplaneta americana]|uniref:Uncharacterized protein n=1 Tax=Periplaneta americana TaxID=6978 RepID=A0ABQ8T9M9_PERAM|nr:hypothetical protein ANN_03966 [Periplaneta americana]
MSLGSSTESYPAFTHIGLRENPQPGSLPRPGIKSGPPGFAPRCANRYSTGVDNSIVKWDVIAFINFNQFRHKMEMAEHASGSIAKARRHSSYILPKQPRGPLKSPVKLSIGRFPDVKGVRNLVPTTSPHSESRYMDEGIDSALDVYLCSLGIIRVTFHGQMICNDHVKLTVYVFVTYARLTSCDVERSLFRDNRHAFVMENLEMTFVVHCNSRPTTSTSSVVGEIPAKRDSKRLQNTAAKRDEVTGEWRKLNNTELHALYSSPDIIRNIKSRRLRWAGHVARMGEYRNAYRVLVGRPEGKRPLGRPRRRWEDNIKMDLREVGYDREWINLAQDRDQWRAYVRAAMNLRVP